MPEPRAEEAVTEDPPVLEAVRRAVIARPGLKSNLSAVKATIEALMADGWTKRSEADIRADERAKVAKLLEDHEETLTGFTGDDSSTVKLVAFMLRLRGDDAI